MFLIQWMTGVVTASAIGYRKTLLTCNRSPKGKVSAVHLAARQKRERVRLCRTDREPKWSSAGCSVAERHDRFILVKMTTSAMGQWGNLLNFHCRKKIPTSTMFSSTANVNISFFFFLSFSFSFVFFVGKTKVNKTCFSLFRAQNKNKKENEKNQAFCL